MRLFFFFSVLLNILFIYYFFSDGDSVENVETEPEEVQATNDLQRISAEILERERAKIPLRIQEFEKLHGVEIDSFVFTKTTEPYEGYLVTTWDIDEKQKLTNEELAANNYNYKYIRKKKVVYVHIESIYESFGDLSWHDSWLNHYYDVDEEK